MLFPDLGRSLPDLLFIQERGKDGHPQHAESPAEAAGRHPAEHPQGQAEEAASAQRKIANLSTIILYT